MARHREHLSKAPLREALIDIQFEPRVSLEAVDRFVTTLGEATRNVTDLWEASFGIEGDGDGRPPKTRMGQTVVGRRLELKHGPYVLQCRPAGFTLSRLSPYGEWIELRAEAQKLWIEFCRHIERVTVNRIAVRYINELRLPFPLVNFGVFLTCPPEVPGELPQGITGFLTRVMIPDEANNSMAVVTQALEGPPSESPTGASVTVLLDIDVFRHGAIEPLLGDALWHGLDVLRLQKNRMFFAHVTEKTLEMYE